MRPRQNGTVPGCEAHSVHDTKQLARSLQSLVAELPAGTAVDVGCGTGDNSIYLARHGWEVAGIVADQTRPSNRRPGAMGATGTIVQAWPSATPEVSQLSHCSCPAWPDS
ncbi:class I SAM-dependent methyltransferase [Rhodococcus spongiicola]|uniref:Class I SAM-dependent methyltransferase n=1 Tax=Rhodococcus spongiicola TaxID=2487352 RepID=A0A3S3DXT9_9NOCA|nr:class I SAM-dependent methyltransferase [Rhodococcus spongiicola]